MAPYSTPEQLSKAHSTLAETFRNGKTKNLAWRKWQLKQIWWMIEDNKEAIAAALHKDLHRSQFESYWADIAGLLRDITRQLDNLEKWTADERPDAGFLFGTLGKAKIVQEPLGVALVIGAWNFPFYLTFMPLLAAVTAGCCVLLKPSEVAVACQDVMAEIVPKYLDQEAIRIVTGGVSEMTAVLKMKFDQIFYTGSPAVGRIISEAAAKNLTPAVLELGGQAPAIVTASADIDVAAKRVALSKFTNAGQICLCSNHVFVDPSVHDAFVKRASHWMKQFMSDKDQFVKIINERQFDRLSGLLDKTAGAIVHGGTMSKADRYIEPTIVIDLNVSDSLMSQELFGPILPVIPAGYQKACDIIQSMPHPLGLYIFSSKESEIDYILTHSQSGGVTINDTIMHAAVPNAPFGGVGNSGTGAYHGKAGFDAFTHRRTVVTIPSWFDRILRIRYPPFDQKNIAKVVPKNPGFKRGEGIEDQVIGRSTKATLTKWLNTSAKAAFVLFLLAFTDAKMGGQPKMLEVFAAAYGWIRNKVLGQ
ncbi:uncharacterized protein KY384_006503 [Bacidia gigantensis]|uniref:uncharacterized protein n=1 Tax=Bacidia gigantensis TaxID=2732470 RepID=UPI001D03C9FC|nr:uncharacterized protein KY384_006503 [Bacidia gigantensis]KAG8528814.1 hypothetical protein KY384_006503 [Bacidia gigantensis]